jgi:hypothetical protein
MPSPLVKSLAKESGESVASVESKWERAKEIVKTEYKLKEKSKRFYPLVVGVLKKMLNIKAESKEDYHSIMESAFTGNDLVLSESERQQLIDSMLLAEGVQKQTAVTSALIDTRTQLDIKMMLNILQTALKPFDVKVLLQPVQKNTRYQILLFARKSHSL